jgi:hypothetical protein
LICGKAVPLAANQKETALSGKSRIHHTVVIGLKAVHFREGEFSAACKARTLRKSPHHLGELHLRGLKPRFLLGLSARLKSCPDTKHQSGDDQKVAHLRGLDLSIRDFALTCRAKRRTSADEAVAHLRRSESIQLFGERVHTHPLTAEGEPLYLDARAL